MEWVQVHTHCKTLFAILYASSLFSALTKMFVPSTKMTNSLWLAELTMSLMYKRKSRGPSTDPCGTPKRIHSVYDFTLVKENF